jgi:hypothetical protein
MRYLPIDRWKPQLPTDLELYNHGTVSWSFACRLEIDMDRDAGRYREEGYTCTFRAAEMSL